MRGTEQKQRLKNGDLLIAIVGATIGSVGVYQHDEPANINQAIAAVRLDSEKLLPEYVSAFLRSSTGQMVLNSISRPVARANINLEEVGALYIPVPEVRIQQTIANEITRCREQARRLRDDANTGWQAAKTRFEVQLLGEPENEGRKTP